MNALIPLPRAVREGGAPLRIAGRAFVVLDPEAPQGAARAATLLSRGLARATGHDLPIAKEPREGTRIAVSYDRGVHDPEGYRLEISPSGVALRAATDAGFLYGAQTIRQLVGPGFEKTPEHGPLQLPGLYIEDSPRFVYRGLHLDVGRHFFPPSFIKRLLDLMCLYKLNRFHWHLTEDQGWRLEIKKYPRLTEIGAFRRETVIGHAANQPARYDGQRYGGFYTQDEVKEIVRYAADRAITIIPEIEMPGHCLAALAAYPQLAACPGTFEPATTFGIFEDIYAPSEQTFRFLEDVLSEVIELFPGEYIHIGGDEAPKTRWKASAVAEEVIRREHLKDEDELQSWFIRRIESFLLSRGRRIIGWDEILEGGLAPHATVMSWRGVYGGIAAAKQGHHVIMTPATHLYFDHYQADPEKEPLAIGGYTPLSHVYDFDPIVPELDEGEARLVLGGQANVWTEYMKTPEHVEYMVFPRLLALAEVLWSPKEQLRFADFRARLVAHAAHLDALGVHYARHFSQDDDTG